MKVRIGPKDEDESYLPPKHIVSVLAQSIPTIKIDWVRGNELVLSQLNNLIALRAPDVIIQSHKALFDETAFVEVSFPKFPDRKISFVVAPLSSIELESGSPDDDELIQFLSEFISANLEYGWREMT